MLKRALPILMIALVAATSVQAQGGGGRGRGGGSGGSGGGRGSSSASGPPARPPKPFSEPEIIGVIQTIDPEVGRLTIAYEPVEVMNWPAGTQPFMLSKLALLKGLSVGEKVRFTLESQQIAAIKPFEQPPGR